MAKLINVFVCNKDGYGLSGKKVKLYSGETKLTDKNGSVSFVAPGSNCTVYVEGREVYNGSVNNAENPITCVRS